VERVTFIRIPKNASTSLYSFFGAANTAIDENLSADNSMHLNIFAPSHQSIEQLEKNLGAYVLDKPVLAVVRNPFERLVSMYFFAKKLDLGRIYGISTQNFRDFASGFYSLSDNADFFHAMPQTKFIAHEQSDTFTVIRFENLYEGLAEFINSNDLADVFDVDRLEKLNSTTHEHYSAYYDEDTIEIVETMWGCDLDAFSYTFKDER